MPSGCGYCLTINNLRLKEAEMLKNWILKLFGYSDEEIELQQDMADYDRHAQVGRRRKRSWWSKLELYQKLGVFALVFFIFSCFFLSYVAVTSYTECKAGRLRDCPAWMSPDEGEEVEGWPTEEPIFATPERVVVHETPRAIAPTVQVVPTATASPMPTQAPTATSISELILGSCPDGQEPDGFLLGCFVEGEVVLFVFEGEEVAERAAELDDGPLVPYGELSFEMHAFVMIDAAHFYQIDTGLNVNSVQGCLGTQNSCIPADGE